MLAWIGSRVRQGSRVGDAIRLWRARDQVAPEIHGDGVAVGIRNRWITACVRLDEAGADAALGDGFARFPVEVVIRDILQAGLADIGEAWRRGEVTPHQEHLATAVATRRIEVLVAAAPPPSRPGRFWCACAPDDLHSLPPLLMTLMLRRAGWSASTLSGNVPETGFSVLVARERPDVVVFTAQHLRAAVGLARAAHELAAAGVPIGFGGGAFVRLPALCAQIHGTYLGDAVLDAVSGATSLIGQSARPIEHPPGDTIGPERHVRLLAALWRRLSGHVTPGVVVDAADALRNVVDTFAVFGAVEGLPSDLSGLSALVGLRQDDETLSAIAAAYAEAADEVIGSPAASAVEYLSRIATSRPDA